MNTTAHSLQFFPSVHPGKWHLDSFGVSLCGKVEIDRSTSPIMASSDDPRVHPICCRRCLAADRKAER